MYYFCPPTYYGGAGAAKVCWLRKIVDPHGNAIVLQRDVFGRVHTIIDTLSREYTLEYESEHGLLSTITDPDGRVIDYRYDFSPFEDVDADGVLDEVDPEYVPRLELVEVLYAPTKHLTNGETIGVARPFVQYTYDEHPDGFEQNDERFLNHNLLMIHRTNTPSVVVDYYRTEDSYEFDRVLSTNIDGRITRFQYEERTPDPDEYGQEVAHITTMRYDDGSLEEYHHSELGMLIRKETLAVKDADIDFVPDSVLPGVNSFIKILEYEDEDYLLIRKSEGSDVGYGESRMRVTEWDYNFDHPDRFQQGNLLQIREYPESTASDPGTPKIKSMEYDPINGRVRKVTDALGRETVREFVHQESDWSVVQDQFGVRGWNFTETDTAWSLGDINSDGRVGSVFSIDGVPTSLFGVARSTKPERDVDAAVPGVGPTNLYHYNDRGQQTAARDEAGTWTQQLYAGGHLYRIVQDPTELKIVEEMSHDHMGRLLKRTSADGQITTAAYDNRDRLITLTRHSLNPTEPAIVSHYFFDLAGRPMGRTEPQFEDDTLFGYGFGEQPLLVERKHYDSGDRVIASEARATFQGTTQVGTTITLYDDRNNLNQVITPLGAVYDISRNSRGSIESYTRTGSDGEAYGTHSFTYSEYSELLTHTRPVDSDGDGELDQMSFVYDGFGREVSQTNAVGTVTKSELDLAGRVLNREVLSAAGHRVAYGEYVHDNLDQLHQAKIENRIVHLDGTSTVATPQWSTTIYKYGTRIGEVVSVTEPVGSDHRQTYFHYDSLGRRTETHRGNDNAVAEIWSLDPHGRIYEKTIRHNNDGVGGGTNNSESVWEYQYDGYGRPEFMTDPKGQKTRTRSDAAGRLVEIEDALGNVTLRAFDSAGQLRSLTEQGPSGTLRTTTRTYDVAGNVTSLVDGELRGTGYFYDSLGRRTHKTHADGTGLEFVYDSVDRVVQKIHLGDSQSTVVAMGYDADDRMSYLFASGADAPVGRLFDYDALGRAVHVLEQVAGGFIVEVKRELTTQGWTASESTKIGDGPARAFSQSHDEVGGLTQRLYPSGLNVDWGYDDLGRLDSITHSSGQPIFQAVSTYGLVGYLEADLLGGSKIEWDFDPLQNILRKEVKASSGSTLLGSSYTYDDNQNLESRSDLTTGVLEEFDYDEFSRLEEWRFGVTGGGTAPTRTVNWDHDDVDNVVHVADSQHATPFSPAVNNLNQQTNYDSFHTFGYSDRGEETGRTAPSDNWVRQWDALGRPYLASRSGAAGTVTVLWIHDGLDRMVGRFDSDGDVTAYSYIDDQLVEIRQGAETQELVYGPHGVWRKRGSEEIVLHTDAFRNVVGLHDGGTVLEAYQYDPFGLPRDGSGQPVTNSPNKNELFFLAEPYDLQTGVSRLGFRQYDPYSERFISRDPMGEVAGLNLYSYGNRNPYRWMDPTGFASEPLDDASANITIPDHYNARFHNFFDATLQGLDDYVWRASRYPESNLSDETFTGLTNDERLSVLADMIGETRESIDTSTSASERKELQTGLDFLNSVLSDVQREAFFDGIVDTLKTGVEIATYIPGPIGTA
ncbi:MAG: RHS repeat-associated core domain-containing protein, partial [Planctomycetota bacterium]